jgi:hypothetical protein
LASTLPVLGSATPDGLFNFIKVDEGLLLADRVIQHSISWDTINNAKFMEGNPFLYNNLSFTNFSGGSGSSANVTQVICTLELLPHRVQLILLMNILRYILHP